VKSHYIQYNHIYRFCIESVGTGNTGVFILKAKTKEEKVYHLLSDVEDESKITPSDEKLDSIQNLLKPVPRYSKDSVKEPVPFIVWVLVSVIGGLGTAPLVPLM
jgi:hypothetical protein